MEHAVAVAIALALTVALAAWLLTRRRAPSVAIALQMTSQPDFPLWLQHHRRLGVRKFYILVDRAPAMLVYLREQPDVVVVERRADNYPQPGLIDRQIAFVNAMLPTVTETWLFHLDSDELLEGDLGWLAALPPTTTHLKLENAEAVYTGAEDSCFAAKTFNRCATATCRSYSNGKGAGRVGPTVSLWGAHDFRDDGPAAQPATPVPFEALRILHFDSCSFGAWAEKFQRLGTDPQTYASNFEAYGKSIEAVRPLYKLYRELTGGRAEGATAGGRAEGATAGAPSP